MAITTSHVSITFLAPRFSSRLMIFLFFANKSVCLYCCGYNKQTNLQSRNEFPCLKKPTRVCISSNFGPFLKSRLTMSYSEYNKLYPPKVETCVHPGHLTSAEKTFVGEELKKSESDCGSSGVHSV